MDKNSQKFTETVKDEEVIFVFKLDNFDCIIGMH